MKNERMGCTSTFRHHLPNISYSPQSDGRKKRKRDSNKPKRQPTAYTMFVHENYDAMKRSHDPNVPGKEIIALIARQWAATSEEEKQVRLWVSDWSFLMNDSLPLSLTQ